MFELYRFNETEILGFALVLMRISVFLAVWPLLGSASVPASVKVLLSLVMALVMFPVVGFKKVEPQLLEDSLVLLIIREVAVGLAMAFVCRLVFFAISICGEIASSNMGLSSAQMFNPQMGAHSTVLEQFYVMLFSVIFLSLNGHHHFLVGLQKSFELVPVGQMTLRPPGPGTLTHFVTETFNIGFRLSAPIAAALFLLNIAMGILGRAVPQINVLVTSWSVNILVGFTLLIVGLPLMMGSTTEAINSSVAQLFGLLKEF